ncbi:omptin family outer membrane protease [Treponema zioleckii]|uniref:omptin family outer membrane protease n=1 Tax=Treponema zioleckii TaxID=331680 RepID=UPI0024135125|nr:omptin family outer membrane protease [Treponema zioleckii]
MRKFPKFLFCVLGLFFSFFANAQNFHISVEPSLGVSCGVLNELLYHSTDTSKKISLLEWERNLILGGTKLNLSYNALRFESSFWVAVPRICGEMRDSDWLNTRNYSMKTNYSVGDNYSDGNYDATISLIYDFEPTPGFFISPKIQAQYAFDSFYRKKGSKGWYGDAEHSSDGKNHYWYDEEAQEYPSVNPETGKTRKLAGIDYYRHSVYLWAGLALGFNYKKFHGDLGFLISPFTYFSAEDRHHTATSNDNVYHEIQQDFFSAYKFNLNLSYAISRFFDLTFNCETLITLTLKGDLYIGWAKDVDQPSGASAQTTSAGLGCRIKLR